MTPPDRYSALAVEVWETIPDTDAWNAEDGIEMIANALRSVALAAYEDAIRCVPGGAICDPQVIADAIRSRAASLRQDAGKGGV